MSARALSSARARAIFNEKRQVLIELGYGVVPLFMAFGETFAWAYRVQPQESISGVAYRILRVVETSLKRRMIKSLNEFTPRLSLRRLIHFVSKYRKNSGKRDYDTNVSKTTPHSSLF